jgi:hypothetical protein
MYTSLAVSQDGGVTALRLQGLSAIANTRLGQSGSSPQRDTVHSKSPQRGQDIGADLSRSHSLDFVTEARDALSLWLPRPARGLTHGGHEA